MTESTEIPTYKHILVALDGSAVAEEVLPHVQSLASKYGSDITLVRAYTPSAALYASAAASSMPGTGPAIDPTLEIEMERGEADTYLNLVAERLMNAGFSVRTDRLSDSPAEAILEAARVSDADLIVMTTHGRTGLSRVLMGSVADHVLHNAHCPVLLIRTHMHDDE